MTHPTSLRPISWDENTKNTDMTWTRKELHGHFHGFTTESYEGEVFTYAIIERPDGTVKTAPVHQIQFQDR